MHVKTILLISIAMMLFTIGCAKADHKGLPLNVKKIDEIITKEIPRGSTVSEVLSFLDAKKIEHSPYSKKNRAIYGILRNSSRGLFVKGSIQLEFLFDENGHLLRHNVKEVFTGP